MLIVSSDRIRGIGVVRGVRELGFSPAADSKIMQSYPIASLDRPLG